MKTKTILLMIILFKRVFPCSEQNPLFYEVDKNKSQKIDSN
jgi:hypothetical protein